MEVYHEGQWGTVCDDYWSIINSNVVCNQLGFHGAQRFTTTETFGEGAGPVWLDDVKCTGHEATLFECNGDRETV